MHIYIYINIHPIFLCADIIPLRPFVDLAFGIEAASDLKVFQDPLFRRCPIGPLKKRPPGVSFWGPV